jgi:hypothetical protein
MQPPMPVTVHPCSHPLSDVRGVYVVAQSGWVSAVYAGFDHLSEALADLDYATAAATRISLCSLTDADADDITHLLGQDMFAGFESYLDWARDNGRNGFAAFWFDQFGAAERRDIERRRAARQQGAPVMPLPCPIAARPR